MEPPTLATRVNQAPNHLVLRVVHENGRSYLAFLLARPFGVFVLVFVEAFEVIRAGTGSTFVCLYRCVGCMYLLITGFLV